MSTGTVPTEAPHRVKSFHGTGLAILRSHVGAGASLLATFTHLRFSFPLKLITPRTSSRDATLWLQSRSELDSDGTCQHDSRHAVAALYIVGYGGGLVSGDDVELDVDVGQSCTLLFLTQGTTKVFKMRQHATMEASAARMTTRQSMRFLVRPRSTLVLLPDAVTCYAAARYLQIQRFDLMCPDSSSLVLLDWITPGRHKLADRGKSAEEWQFQSYRSRNEVRIRGCGVVVRDVLELAQDEGDNTLKERTAPYKMYASLFLIGPAAAACVRALEKEWKSIQQRPVMLMSGRGHDSAGAYGSTSPALSNMAISRAQRNAEAVAAGLPIQQGLCDGDADGVDIEGLGEMRLLWSFSHLQLPVALAPSNDCIANETKLANTVGAMIRLAALDTDAVKGWLRDRLGSLRDDVIGPDLYRQALG